MDDDDIRIAQLVIARGRGAVPTASLLDEGLTRATIAAMVDQGALVRIRTGWFGSPSTDPRIVAAVCAGGAAACATALAIAGVWVGDSSRLHVSRRAGVPGDAGTEGHRRLPGDDPRACVEPVKEAIARFIRCAPFDEAIATIDSALRLSGTLGWRFDRGDLADVLRAAPRRYRRMIDWVDPSADSGLESLVRVRLRRLGLRVRSQARIQGVGRVDLLVGDRLVIETDGRRHHLGDQFARDRHRDTTLLGLGYLVLRLTWSDVLHGWDRVERLVLDLARRGDHRATARHRPSVMATNDR